MIKRCFVIGKSLRYNSEQAQKYINETTGKKTIGLLRVEFVSTLPAEDIVDDVQRACSHVGDVILVNEKDYTCTEDDLLSFGSNKYEALVGESYLKDLVEGIIEDLNIQIYRIISEISVESDIYGDVRFSRVQYPKDLIIIQTFRPDNYDVYGSGESLVYDQNGRPILGHINWNPKLFDPKNDAMNYRVGLHSLLHVLGFGAECMLNFRNISTESDETEILDPYSTPSVVGRTLDNREFSLLASPRVAKEFKEYTGCNDIEGAILEDMGGAGIAGSHWKMSVLMNEIMTATVHEHSVLTPITVAALEDSGWYMNLNYKWKSLGHVMFGYKRGCEFMEKRCNTSWPVGNGYFCTTLGEDGCTADRKATGSCDIRTYGNGTVPAEYQYFPGPNASRIGGPDAYVDYCPYYTPTYYCDSAPPSEDFYGDKGGSDSRCFMSTLTRSSGTVLNPEKPMCYPIKCYSKTEYAVKVGKYYYACSKGGSITGVQSYNGSIKCADPEVLCGYEADDSTFPVFYSIEPNKTKSGEKVTITGKNFGKVTVVALGASCSHLKINDDFTTIECTVEHGVAGVNDVIIKTAKYSVLAPKSFELEGGSEWWFLMICVGIAALVLIAVIFIVICRCCSKKKKLKKKS